MEESGRVQQLKGFSMLLRLQILSKVFTFLFTFFFNLLIIRKLRPEDNGLSVQFHLITTSVLFLSREGFRRGCLRAKPGAIRLSEQAELERVSGVATLPVFTGGIVCAIVCVFLIKSKEKSGDFVYAHSVALHGIAIFLELLSEPFYIIAHVWTRMTRKLWVEGSATVSKCLTTFVFLYFTEWRPEYCFSAGQISYGAITLIGYGLLVPEIYRKAGSRMVEIFSHFDPGVLKLSLSFLLQSVLKLLLAEGSNYVLVLFVSQYNQGIFGVVTGLGSLVVRTVFQPIEEASFVAFSRAGVAKEDNSALRELSSLVAALIRGISLVGLLAVVFGPPNSGTLLRILYSEKWSDTEAPIVLGWYCAYIFLLALNGVTEAFVHAVMDADRLFQSNAWMVGVGIVNVLAGAYLSSKLGPVGLILGDGLGMYLRISYSMWCIKEYFPYKLFRFSQLFPSTYTICILGAAAWISWMCQLFIQLNDLAFLLSASIQIGIALACLSAVLFVMYKNERVAWEVLLSSHKAAKKET